MNEMSRVTKPGWDGDLGGMPSTYRFNEPLATAHLVYKAAGELGLHVQRLATGGNIYDAATWSDTSPVTKKVPTDNIRYGVDFSEKPGARPLFTSRLKELRAEESSKEVV